MSKFEKTIPNSGPSAGYRITYRLPRFVVGQMPSGDPYLRSLDMILAGVALMVLFPLMLLVALTVYLTDRGPVFYAQRRIGRGGKRFPCYKFRSMVTNADERLKELLERDPQARAEWALDHKLKNDPRITAIGGFLRKSSLDELPQLFNVLKGDMSLVGPRPIVEAEVTRYGRYFQAYCAVRPGITGLWQVSGRNDVSYRRRVAFDVVYSRTRSIRLNLKIIAATVPAVTMSRGSY